MKRFGSIEELSKEHKDPIAWARQEIEETTRLEKEGNSRVVLELDPTKFLEKGNQRIHLVTL